MLITELEAKVLERREAISFDEALAILDLPAEEVPALTAVAHKVRLRHAGPEVDVESIISAKTGGCSEDCTFCSQSRHWPTPVLPRLFLDIERIVEAARRSEELGATEFCIVLAIKGPDARIMEQVLRAVDALHESTGLQVACSLGLLTVEQVRALADSGVHRYNHNLESARSFFPAICTSHTWEDRFETCGLVKQAGMELCCGGIFGMGETSRQRVELAFELKALGPHEVPVNFLNPRPGTPLENRPPLHPLDAIKTIAMLRLVMPGVILRYAGGRESTLGDLQSLGMVAGINALIIGNYLTTLGRRPEQDLWMLQGLGMPVASEALRTPKPSGDASSAPPEPPRLCPACGRRLSVQVTPDGFEALCRTCRTRTQTAGG